MNLNDLNPMQRRAAETLEGPVLILAGAGSGKTRTLTYRVANLLEHGVKAWHILALTFTNKAAREMRERIERLAGADAGEAWIGTFHSICCRILRRDIEKLGYERSFTIYDDDDQQRVIKAVLKELDIDEKFLPPKAVSADISDAKNRLLSPDEWLQKRGGLEAMKEYNEKKAKILYDFLDESKLFKGTVRKEDRSLMNVPFITGNTDLDAKFVAEAKKNGLENLKGHRSVGGMRASIYNAMPMEGVEKLVAFMKEFEAQNQ